jgi:tetratricopeptide (TPR) repeat protein
MSVVGRANLLLGLYDQAVLLCRRAIEANRNYPPAYFSLAVALAQLDRLDEAHSGVRAGLALNPNFAISRARASWTAMSDDPTYLAQLEPVFDGLRKAGPPEGEKTTN